MPTPYILKPYTLSIYLSLSVCLFVSLSVGLSACLSIYASIHMPTRITHIMSYGGPQAPLRKRQHVATARKQKLFGRLKQCYKLPTIELLN